MAAARSAVKAKVLTQGGQVERFFLHYLHHTKGPLAGQPFRLEEWEREFVREFYSVDAKGNRVYRLGILGVPRGNGKTPLAAGFGLYEMMSRKDSPDVFCAAGSKEQAQLIMDFARAFVESGELLTKSRVRPGRRSLTYAKTGAVMRAVSSSGALQHGLSVSAAIADELHAFTSDNQVEVWTALWTSLHKRHNSFALAITTAGFDKATLLGRMYDAAMQLPEQENRPCLRIRRDRENGVLCYWYGVPETQADDWENPELWRQANPASWISVEELRRQLHAPGTDEYDFRRLHLNMWTKAKDAWLPAGCWDGLADDELKAPAETVAIYAGVDVGWTHDSTACVYAFRVGDRIALKAKVWTTDPDQLGIYVPGGKMRLELVEDYLRELKREHKLKEVAYDPRYFGRSAEELEKEGFVMVEMLPQSAPMWEAWQSFYQAANEEELLHDGDEILAAHVEAAAADKTESGWKVRKLKSTSRIDALAAAVMAHAGCQLRGSGQGSPQIFWLD